MLAKSTTCLLLTLMLLILTVPAFADGNPPPIPNDGNIHPWDNNDGLRASTGPHIVSVGWMWLNGTSSGFVFYLPGRNTTQPTKYEVNSGKAIRSLNGTPVVTTKR